MTAVTDRTDYVEPQRFTERSRGAASEQSVLLASAGLTALLALVVGVVAAYLIFPEPTMWRIAVNGLVIALAVFPIRALVRRASALSDRATMHAGGHLMSDAESEF